MKISKSTHILLIILITLIVFSGSLNNGFVWDDHFLIEGNHYIKNWQYTPKFFTTQIYEGNRMHSNYYRPFQSLSYAADYSIWKLNPFGYHLSNLFLHIINCILVYFILAAISSSLVLAFMTAVLFAVSPATSMVTYYISSRADLLMAFFMFLSFLLFSDYLKNTRKSLYVFSVICFILALFSREAAIILPILLILEGWRQKERKPKVISPILPYLIVTIFYVFSRFTFLNFSNNKNPLMQVAYSVSMPLKMRLLTDFKIILEYLKLLIYPHGLHMQRFIQPAQSIFQKEVMFSIAVIVLLIFVVKRISRFQRLVLFGAFWFLLCLAPVLNIYPVSILLHEGWLYMPSMGLYIIFSIFIKDILSSKIGKVFSMVIFALFLIFYSAITAAYGRSWKDSISVFNNILKYEKAPPLIQSTYNNLGVAYKRKGDYIKAIQYFKKSIILAPKHTAAYTNLGSSCAAIGKHIEGIKFLKKAISLNKNCVEAYCNLSRAYYKIGFTKRAEQFLLMAIKIEPSFYRVYCELGYLYSQENRFDEAIGLFKKAVELREDVFDLHLFLGSVYIKKGWFKEALDEYNRALELGSGDYRFYNQLAFLYVKNDRFKEAEDVLLYSLQLDSEQACSRYNLGDLYCMFRYFDIAIEEYRKALLIEPGNLIIGDKIKKAKSHWKDMLKEKSRPLKKHQ